VIRCRKNIGLQEPDVHNSSHYKKNPTSVRVIYILEEALQKKEKKESVYDRGRGFAHKNAPLRKRQIPARGGTFNKGILQGQSSLQRKRTTDGVSGVQERTKA